MDRLAVTGIGVVSAVAFGRTDYETAVRNAGHNGPARTVDGFALEDHLPGAHAFRRTARATRFTLAAVAMALSDAGIRSDPAGGEEAGLIVGVTHGALEYSARFHRGLLTEGPIGASPLHFSESVLNAPAGNAAIAFGIRGPVHTLIGEETVGTESVALASLLLRTGSLSWCLVAGAEERSDLVDAAYRRMHRAMGGHPGAWESRPTTGEGGVALVLEREGAAARRGANVHAHVSGWATGADRGGTMEKETMAVIEQAFRRSGARPGAGHYLPPTVGRRAAVDRAVARVLGPGGIPPHRIDIRGLLGNPVGAANLFQVAASAAALSAGSARGPGLVLSAGIEGTVAALVLSVPGREEN